MIDANTIATPLEVASRVTEFMKSATTNTLAEYTAPTRLTPIVLIDKRVLDVDQGMVKDLLQTMLSIYSAHYLMAVNMELNVSNVNVMRILDKYSTDRDILRAAGTSTFLGMESYQGSEEFNDFFGVSVKVPGMESIYSSFSSGMDKVNISVQTSDAYRDNEGKVNSKDTISTITDDSNLAVGKVLDVRVSTNDGRAISIPVNVSVVPKTITSNELVNITLANAIDTSYEGRYHQWRSGEIRFLKDFLLCEDILEADRKALMADRTGTLLALRSSRTKNILAAVLSGRASPNAISTMVVVSKETATQMEEVLKGKLKSSHTREQWFKSTVAMMLVVVDTVMERFTIYQRGIDQPGTYTLDEIKHAKTSSRSNDIDMIMKAYKLGQSPSL